jgi:hypothetical protein
MFALALMFLVAVIFIYLGHPRRGSHLSRGILPRFFSLVKPLRELLLLPEKIFRAPKRRQ